MENYSGQILAGLISTIGMGISVFLAMWRQKVSDFSTRKIALNEKSLEFYVKLSEITASREFNAVILEKIFMLFSVAEHKLYISPLIWYRIETMNDIVNACTENEREKEILEKRLEKEYRQTRILISGEFCRVRKSLGYPNDGMLTQIRITYGWFLFCCIIIGSFFITMIIMVLYYARMAEGEYISAVLTVIAPISVLFLITIFREKIYYKKYKRNWMYIVYTRERNRRRLERRYKQPSEKTIEEKKNNGNA